MLDNAGDVPRDEVAQRRSSAADHGRAFKVEDIKKGEVDARDATIEHIYALRSEGYAIYKAGDVWVQYADAEKTERKQRARVLVVGEARADLTTLLSGWPDERRRPYDCKIAVALQLLLDQDDEGDSAREMAARKIMEGARDDARNERAVAGRLQYLCVVLLGCLLLGALLWGLMSVSAPLSDVETASKTAKLLLAGQAGLLGAAFSVVLAVKARTVALDTHPRGNLLDGSLRLVIGAVSGGLLLLLLGSDLASQVHFADKPLSIAVGGWEGVVIIGFIAGFVERMVPDLLNKAQQQPAGAPTPKPA